jgi:DNA-binding response OmpR family regulator
MRKSAADGAVLVVERDPATLALLSAVLKSGGIRSLLARSEAEAREIASRRYPPVRLVLSNVPMANALPGIPMLPAPTAADGGVIRIGPGLIEAIRISLKSE